MKKPKTETRGPLLAKDGSVAVDPKTCPTLHRALTQMVERGTSRAAWAKVAELRAKGELEAAGRAARKAMGIQGEPMDEETKAKLRAYAEEHKDEIRARAQQQREVRRRTLALLTTGRRSK